jgi:excisionase family DNA binding protein
MRSKRVSSLRRVHGIHACRSAEKDGEWLTMSEAAVMLGVSAHRVRRLVNEGILPAEQVVSDAPWQIRATDLREPRVMDALAARRVPCRTDRQSELPIFLGA